MPFDEATIVNQVAAQERAIAGVRNSYDFAANPDVLPNNALPAVLHYSPSFALVPRAHHNVWSTNLELRSILFVAPREEKGGKLRYLENAAIPFGNLWRVRFTTASVLDTLSANIGGVKFFLESGRYGVGGDELTFNGIPFVGFVFSWVFVSA